MPSTIRPPRKTGTERLLCPACPDIPTVYMTTVGIRRGPLPACGSCGARMMPEHPYLALEVLTADEQTRHPWLLELGDELASVTHGQASHYKRAGGSYRLKDPSVIAEARIARALSDDAARRRAAQLAQNVRAAYAASEPQPF